MEYPDNLVQFRATPAIMAQIAARQFTYSRGLTAARDLARYYYLLEQELPTITLTEAEALLIVDVLHAADYEPHTMKYIWAEVADAGQAFAQYGVSSTTLIPKLRALTPAQQFAIADAVERFWIDTPTATAERLREVGLLR